ncbi:MAG TPA: protealysin inhibitor emfourin [Mycobacteriales bacterium]|nr:protealysin inhibitor emfourin [Mycobacteriales bacterium]
MVTRSTALRLAALAVAAVVLGGCGGSPPSPAGSTAPPAPSSSAPAPAPTPGETIRYVRSGGVAGLRESLVITPDGTAVLTSRQFPSPRRSPLTAAERTALASALAQAELQPAPRRRSLRPGHPDEFSYTVTVGSVTLHLTQSAVPTRLRPLLAVLQGVANRLISTP